MIIDDENGGTVSLRDGIVYVDGEEETEMRLMDGFHFLPRPTSEMVDKLQKADHLTNEELQTLHIFFTEITELSELVPEYKLMVNDARWRLYAITSFLRARGIDVPARAK